ncbi:TM2 domain-containing protein [uncultured Oxalicibacterium sp.]|uniref:TM2 domain-containing protein n=1 Tax=uncultured Oxalicibacterium sp. TaxID=1168540 RepID=UPI0025F0CCBE|nr:TM2 domain-containing protein [uncultured Oxalicibacterium sp.]
MNATSTTESPSLTTTPGTHAHRNKTVAMLLAVFLGGTGAHRFYLHGKRDFLAWNYLLALLLFICALIVARGPHSWTVSVLALFPVSIYIGWIEALMIGLTSDEHWDARFNRGSAHKSQSRWPIVVLLVLTFAIGITGFLFSLTRAIDLFLTNGAFG